MKSKYVYKKLVENIVVVLVDQQNVVLYIQFPLWNVCSINSEFSSINMSTDNSGTNIQFNWSFQQWLGSVLSELYGINW